MSVSEQLPQLGGTGMDSGKGVHASAMRGGQPGYVRFVDWLRSACESSPELRAWVMANIPEKLPELGSDRGVHRASMRVGGGHEH